MLHTQLISDVTLTLHCSVSITLPQPQFAGVVHEPGVCSALWRSPPALPPSQGVGRAAFNSSSQLRPLWFTFNPFMH